jgi:hypothetical protein
MYDAITGHITNNLWLWTAIGLGVSALGIVAMGSLGKGYYLAEIVTLSAMFGATTMILVSQKGMAHPAAVDDDA